MKMKTRFLALAMALMLLLSVAPALAEATDAPSADGDPVLATFNGTPILKSECDELINYYAANYSAAFTYAQALENLVYNRVFEEKIKELGFDQFTDEENAEFASEAQLTWDEAIASYVDYYLTEDTDEARKAMNVQANDYYTAQGYSVEYLAENIKLNKAYDRLNSYLLGDKTVSDADVDAAYQQTVEQQKGMIGDSASMYEVYNYYYGGMYYIPSGYRAVLHILLQGGEELLTDLENAQNAYEELVSQMDEQANAAEGEATAAPEADATVAPTAEPVTQEQIDAALAAVNAAKQAVMDSKQEQIDAINTRLAAGEDFVTVAKEYNEDPGLDYLTGYNVHKESMMYDTAFRDAAFSDKMQKIGDYSDPVVGNYGVHILYYLADVAEGALPMTDEVKESIKSELKNEQLYAAQNSAYSDWVEDYEVVNNADLINELDGAGDQDATDAPAAATDAPAAE